EEAPSAHGEAVRVGEILSEEGSVPGETVVVLPDPHTLLPLLWEGLGVLKEEFNVTLGYPLARSPLFTLLDAVLGAAEEGEGEVLPREAYLRLLFHPYVKNFAPEGLAPGSLRVFFHAVEDFLRREGRRKVDLGALEREDEPRRRARALNPQGPPEEALAAALARAHDLFFRQVRAASTLEGLAVTLERLLGVVAEGSPAPRHPFYRPSFQAAARCLAGLAAAGREEEGSAPEPRRLFAFVRERLSEVRVPFTGLPVRGLQVMGVLETQALRFPRVILLDADDEVLPTVPAPDPLLPPAFRQALGLPGVLERAEIYRYHVFRLLQSSGRAWVLYAAQPGRSRSPFVEQLLWEARRAGREGRVSPLAFRTGGRAEPVAAVPKGPEVLERLRGLVLSPTSLDKYLRCPLLFYWDAVLSLRERESEEEETERLEVGRLLHEVLEELFKPYAEKPLDEGDFAAMRARLPSLVQEAFRERDSGFLLALLAKDRLGKLLDREREGWEPGARVAGVEYKLHLDLGESGGPPVRVEGKVDRLDLLPGGRLRLTDYKLGHNLAGRYLPARTLPGPQDDRPTLLRGLRSLQLPLYAEMVRRVRGVPPDQIEARLLSLRDPRESPATLAGVAGGLPAFLDDLLVPVVRRLAEEILDPDRPFEAAPAEPGACGACPGAPLCRRPLAGPGV
ncbi:MAG: PD-(D/E)XK nuclease family protein, partial [Acidobacteriota bacterium]